MFIFAYIKNSFIFALLFYKDVSSNSIIKALKNKKRNPTEVGLVKGYYPFDKITHLTISNKAVQAKLMK